MSSRNIDIVVRAKDEASRILQGLSVGQLAALAAAGYAVAKAFRAVSDAMAAAVKQAAEQETADARLALALRNVGDSSSATLTSLRSYAGGIQQTTTYTDDAVQESLTLLTTLGRLRDEGLKSAERAALDLATGLGVDLRTATLLVAKAATGHTEALGRYGLAVDETLGPQERFNALLGAISERFGGAAQAELDTYAGKVKNLGNKWGEVWEQLGFLVTKDEQVNATLGTWGTLADRLAKALELASEGGLTLTNIMAGHLLGQMSLGPDEFTGSRGPAPSTPDQDEVDRIIAAITKREEAQREKDLKAQQDYNDAVTKATADRINDRVEREERASAQVEALMMQESATAQEAALRTQEIHDAAAERAYNLALTKREIEDEFYSDALYAELGITTNLEEQSEIRKAIIDEEYRSRMALARSVGADTTNLEKRYGVAIKTVDNSIRDQKLQNASMILAASSNAIGQLFGKSKAAAIAQAVIQTALAVMQALSSAPPPVSYVLAAIATAMGVVQVHKIRTADYALGGFVTGGVPGRDSVPAMLQPGEYVVPKHIMDSLGGGSGAQVAINLNFDGAGTATGGIPAGAMKIAALIKDAVERSGLALTATHIMRDGIPVPASRL